MSKRVCVGLDVGSSSLKYSIFNAETGSLIGNGKQNYQESGPQGRRSAGVFEQAIQSTVARLSQGSTIVSVALATQMYSLLEKQGEELVLHQWNSVWESGAAGSGAAAEVPAEELFAVSGCPNGILFPARKLAVASPETRRRFLPYGIKEHLLEKLSGVLATDYTTASASGFVDVRSGGWNNSLITALGYEPDRFPQIFAHNTSVGPARFPGLENCAVVAPGLGDGPAGSYACRALSETCGNLGTSTAVRRISGSLDGVETKSLWRFRMSSDSYVYGAISASGCAVIDWSRTQFLGGGEERPLLLSPEEPMFFPWINGEFSPYWNERARGVYWGVTPATTPELFHAAVVEGVAFSVARMVNLVCAQEPQTRQVVFGGGGIHNQQLLQIIASAISQELVLLNDSEHLVSIGAAISACEAAGIPVNYSPEAVTTHIEKHAGLQERYARWCSLADRIQLEFA